MKTETEKLKHRINVKLFYAENKTDYSLMIHRDYDTIVGGRDYNVLNKIDFGKTGEANATYICKAVNNYEALLSALKDFCDLRTAQSNEDFIKAYHKAHEAIKQAEESI